MMTTSFQILFSIIKNHMLNSARRAMIFRLFVKMPDEGWVLACSVDASDAEQALSEAKLMLKPQHHGKPTKLLPGDLPPPKETLPNGLSADRR